jgi:hypothetical protein
MSTIGSLLDHVTKQNDGIHKYATNLIWMHPHNITKMIHAIINDFKFVNAQYLSMHNIIQSHKT